jgi:hypothetical protein
MSSEEMSLAARVQRLEDIEAIKQLKTRYAQGADDKNQTKLPLDVRMSFFSEDAVFEIEREGRPERYEGRPTIREFLLKGYAAIPWSIHYMIAPIIEITEGGQSARGSWYLLELATMPHSKNGELEAVWVAGTYDDEFVKEDSVWKFKKVKLRLDLMSPYADGWATKAFRN